MDDLLEGTERDVPGEGVRAVRRRADARARPPKAMLPHIGIADGPYGAYGPYGVPVPLSGRLDESHNDMVMAHLVMPYIVMPPVPPLTLFDEGHNYIGRTRRSC